MRTDKRSILRRCLDLMVSIADSKTKTTRPTRAYLAKSLGVHTRSISRYWKALEKMGLIARVATGRSAAYASRNNEGQPMNEAAVWVLCIPSPEIREEWQRGNTLQMPNKSEDQLVTPPSKAGFSLKEENINPRTRTINTLSPGSCQEQEMKKSNEIDWKKHVSPSSKAEMLAASRKLRALAPYVFGKMSDRDIVSSVRDFFQSEWSPADINHALTWQPNDQYWPHSALPPVSELHRVRGWVKYRLNGWRTKCGVPLTSYGNRRKAEAVQRKLDRKTEVLRAQERKKKIQQTANPELKESALSAMREMFRRNRQRKDSAFAKHAP